MSRSHLLILFILFISIISIGCKKEYLEPDSVGLPKYSITGTLDGKPLDLQLGIAGIYAETRIIEQFDQRIWLFSTYDTSNTDTPRFEIAFGNNIVPFGDTLDDMHKTFTSGAHDFANVIPPPTDPFQLKDVIVSYWDSTNEFYSSLLVDQPLVKFMITGTVDITNKPLFYKEVTATFDCQLANAAGTDTLEIQNGKAVIVFGGF